MFTGGDSGLVSEASSDKTAWVVGAANGSQFTGGHVKAIAYCAASGQAVAAASRSETAATRGQVASLVAEFKSAQR